MPILLGDGQRLFEHIEGMQIMLKKIRIIETGQRTDIQLAFKDDLVTDEIHVKGC